MNAAQALDAIAYRWVRVTAYLVLLTPLVVPTWVIFPYTFGKSLYFFTLVSAAVPWYLVLLITRPTNRPALTPVLMATALYLIIIVVPVLTSVDPHRSFWGDAERMTGYWPLLHYVIFFLMVGSAFRTEREIARLLEFSVGISFFVALVALLQKIEPELIWRMQNGRVGSLLSNPAFLGDYLVCNGLLGVWLFSRVNRSLERQVLAAVIGVLLVAVLLSETRAALLGLYLATLAYLSVKALLEKVPCRRLLFRSGLVALALVPVVVWVAGSSPLLAGVPGMGRFADVSWGSANVEARLINWGIALEGFQERPIFGWGPETYYHVFDLHYDPRIEELEFSAKGFDRPHNRLLEQLSDTGVLGGLAYLASLLLVVGHLLMAYQRGRIGVDTLAASIAIGVSFLVQGFFLFDHPVGLLMLAMVLAWWHVAGGRARLAGGLDGPPAAAGDARRGNGVRIAVALVVAIAVSAAHWFSFIAKPAWASYRVRHAASLASSDFPRASEIVEAVLANSQQYRPMAVEYYARMVIQRAKQSQHPDAFVADKLQSAYHALDSLAASGAASSKIWLLMAMIQVELAKQDDEHLAQAMRDVDKALAMSPRRQHVLAAKARIATLLGDFNGAARTLQQLVELAPSASAWRELGLAQFKGGEIEEAVASFRRAAEWLE